jgi:hypothetical protein
MPCPLAHSRTLAVSTAAPRRPRAALLAEPLGGVPFTVKLSNCTSDSSYNLTATYTGNWGSRPVNVTLTENLQSEENGPSTPPTLSGTVGSQQVSGVPNIVSASGAPGQTSQISDTITVS